MAAYQVELTARARKQYKALDPVIRDRIRRTLLDLADDPTPAQVKALAGGDGLLRVRVGAWRVIYRVERDPASSSSILATAALCTAACRPNAHDVTWVGVAES